MLRFNLKSVVSIHRRTIATLATGYRPSRRLMFDGDEAKDELWEIKFLGFMRLHDVILAVGELDEENAPKKIDAFVQLIQCLMIVAYPWS